MGVLHVPGIWRSMTPDPWQHKRGELTCQSSVHVKRYATQHAAGGRHHARATSGGAVQPLSGRLRDSGNQGGAVWQRRAAPDAAAVLQHQHMQPAGWGWPPTSRGANGASKLLKLKVRISDAAQRRSAAGFEAALSIEAKGISDERL